MGKMDIKSENSNLWEMYTDIFSLHKKYGNVEDSEEYWTELVKDASFLHDKYANTPESKIAFAMLTAIIDYLDNNFRKDDTSSC